MLVILVTREVRIKIVSVKIMYFASKMVKNNHFHKLIHLKSNEELQWQPQTAAATVWLMLSPA